MSKGNEDWQKAVETARKQTGETGPATKGSKLYRSAAEIYCPGHPGSKPCEFLEEEEKKQASGKKPSLPTNYVYASKSVTRRSPAVAEAAWIEIIPYRPPVVAPVESSITNAAGLEIFASIIEQLLGSTALVKASEAQVKSTDFRWDLEKYVGKDATDALKAINADPAMRAKASDLLRAGLPRAQAFLDVTDCTQHFIGIMQHGAPDADSISTVACIKDVEVTPAKCKEFTVPDTIKMPLPVSVTYALSYVEHENISHATEKGTWVGEHNIYRETLAGMFLSTLVDNKLTPHISATYASYPIISATTDFNRFIDSKKDSTKGIRSSSTKADVTLPGMCIVAEAAQSSLSEILPQLTLAQIKVVLLQTCQALISARLHFGFFHNNLTLENVQLAAVPSDTVFYYRLSGNIRGIPTHGLSCRLTGFKKCTSVVFDPLDTSMGKAPTENEAVMRDLSDLAFLVDCMRRKLTAPSLFLNRVAKWLQEDWKFFERSSAAAPSTGPTPTDTSALHRAFQFIAGTEFPVTTDVPAKHRAHVYNTEGRIKNANTALAGEMGKYLQFDPIFAELHMSRKLHQVKPDDLKAIASDAANRVRRRCGLNPVCAEKRKIVDKEKRDAISKLAELSEIIKDMVQDVKTQTVKAESSPSKRAKSASKAKKWICNGGVCQLAE